MLKPLFLHYTYYHCAKRSKTKCKQRSIRVAELEKQIQEQLGHIQISAEFRDWAIKYVRELHNDEINSVQRITKSTERAYADCLKRIESLVQLKTSPENSDGSLLSDEEYSQQREKYLREKAALRHSPNDVKIQAEEALRQSEEIFKFAHSACNAFERGDFQLKKQILATIGSNLFLADKKLIIEAKKPFVLLQNFIANGNCKNTRFEPRNDQAKQSQNTQGSDTFLTQLSNLREVRTYERKMKKLVAKVYHHFYESGPYMWN